MKKTLVTLAVAALAVSSFAQGTLNVLNTSGSTFRSQIYGPQLVDATASLSGNSTTGNPPGTTAYTGPLLAGTGFTFAVYYGAAGTAENALSLLLTTTFRTGGAAGLIAPIPDVQLAGVAPGASAVLQVRAWDNAGGTITSWADATTRGSSGLFNSAPLGGGVLLAPDMTGWQSFNIYQAIPEPSTFVLAGLGAASLLIFRRRK